MTHRLRQIVPAVCLILAAVVVPVAAEVEWSEVSYEEAVAQAQASDRYVLIDFYTTWCGPCKQLDRETYTDAKVSEMVGRMVALKYDCEKGAGIDVAKKYRISAYPTVVLLGPSGDEIDRFIGFRDAVAFVQTVGDYMKGIGTVAFYREKVRNDPNDKDSWRILGRKHVDAGRNAQAVEALTRFMQLAPNVVGEERAELLYTLAGAHYQSKELSEAAGIYEKLQQEFADTEWLDRATVRLARTYYGMNATESCIKSYMEYVNRNADDPRALNSFAWFCASRKVGLDEALPIALKAAELSNRDAGILDTLAELYFARGEYDNAIKIGEEALGKDPEDSYLSDQVKKFTEAKAVAQRRAAN